MDAHIIEITKLKLLIRSIPYVLEMAQRENVTPYLAIQPYSYRKTWNKDKEGYNFVSDFLGSFTEFDFPDDLQNALIETRKNLVNNFTNQELYSFFLSATSESSKRRNRTITLPVLFLKKIQSWEEVSKQHYITGKKINTDRER